MLLVRKESSMQLLPDKRSLHTDADRDLLPWWRLAAARRSAHVPQRDAVKLAPSSIQADLLNLRVWYLYPWERIVPERA